VLALNAEAPSFDLPGVAGGSVRRYTLADLARGWLVLFFYPADFTFVCPTEIRGFEQSLPEIRRAGAEVAAISGDDTESHRAWAEELGGVSYPLLSDPAGDVSRAYGVRDEEAGRPHRATFVITPERRIAHLTVSPMNVGRSVDDTLRVLQALLTGKLCPADWRPGQPTLHR
jgi:peroxiredoxin (alkyl hydroperoxide reductase subunit C)